MNNFNKKSYAIYTTIVKFSVLVLLVVPFGASQNSSVGNSVWTLSTLHSLSTVNTQQQTVVISVESSTLSQTSSLQVVQATRSTHMTSNLASSDSTSTITPSASEQLFITKSVTSPTPSPTPRGFNETQLLVGVVSAGGGVAVILVAMVMVLCSVVCRKRRKTILVQSSHKTNDTGPQDSFVAGARGSPPIANNPVTQIEIRVTNTSELGYPGSQGSDLQDYSHLTRGNPPAGKHASVHWYYTIDTIRREYELHAPQRPESDSHDYESLRRHTATVSLVAVSTEDLSNLKTSRAPSEYEIPSRCSEYEVPSRCSEYEVPSRCSTELDYVRTQSAVPSEYEVPKGGSGSSSDHTLCPSACSSYESIDDCVPGREVWSRWDSAKIREKLREIQSASRSSMDGPYSEPPTDPAQLHKRLKELCINIISTKDIITELGMIQPSLVTQRAVLTRGGRERPVTIRGRHPSEEQEQARTLLLQEAVIMGQIRHPNVVQLHGVIMEENQMMLVVEQFPKEDLRRFLVQLGRSVIHPDAPRLLLSFSQQVALGMHYLASKGFVHRDLAARNVFITRNSMCKVGELAKCLEYANPEDYVIKGGKLPIRWMSPEAMYRSKYSTASDVWSYGCLLYEIWSLGRMPFREYTNAQVIEKVDAGYRIPPPPGCPKLIYDLMIQCWHPNPLKRPSFKDLLTTLLTDETQVLLIPLQDAATNEDAIVLGSDLEAGKFMYTQLQARYLGTPEALVKPPYHNPSPKTPPTTRPPVKKSDYDHISHKKVVMAAFPTSSSDIDYMYQGQTNNKENGFFEQTEFRQRLLTNDRSDYADI